ncbi:hypothetical protein DFJ74DRAFT_660096 [Hyaloraphidium curvatum]|nr:hypothetical protein DFJ74DRAFT_660096 [Hyaloraphidium curvatum]
MALRTAPLALSWRSLTFRVAGSLACTSLRTLSMISVGPLASVWVVLWGLPLLRTGSGTHDWASSSSSPVRSHTMAAEGDLLSLAVCSGLDRGSASLAGGGSEGDRESRWARAAGSELRSSMTGGSEGAGEMRRSGTTGSAGGVTGKGTSASTWAAGLPWRKLLKLAAVAAIMLRRLAFSACKAAASTLARST